jgi:hypothetical protein
LGSDAKGGTENGTMASGMFPEESKAEIGYELLPENTVRELYRK